MDKGFLLLAWLEEQGIEYSLPDPLLVTVKPKRNDNPNPEVGFSLRIGRDSVMVCEGDEGKSHYMSLYAPDSFEQIIKTINHCLEHPDCDGCPCKSPPFYTKEGDLS